MSRASDLILPRVDGLALDPVIPEDSLDRVREAAETPADGLTFYERNSELRPEIIEGLLRESQIAIVAGTYGVGKSPLLADIAVKAVHGLPWCGRRIESRPVIAVDYESGGPAYRRNLVNIAKHLNVEVPLVPEQMEIFLANDIGSEAQTAELLSLMDKQNAGFELLGKALSRKPNALVMIDPVELFYLVDKMKGTQILRLYRGLKQVLSSFPKAAMLLTFNLRKKDRRAIKSPNLLMAPRDWLEEVSGSLDILNRCDVRLGIDFHNEDVRVINGIRRGEDLHPILLRPVGDPPDHLGGFEMVLPSDLDLTDSLTPKQQQYWLALPSEYRFEDVADTKVPRSTLSRLHTRAKSLGILEEHDGQFKKVGLRPGD